MKINISILSIFLSLSVAAQSPDKALIIHYDFESATGTTVPDLSGNGNHGVITNMSGNFKIENAPDANGHSFGKVFHKPIAGKPGHITTPINLFKRGFEDYTLAFWVCITNDISISCGNVQMIGCSPSGSTVNPNTQQLAGIENGYFVGMSNFGTPFPLTDTNGNIPGEKVELGKWYHYAVVSSATDQKSTLYINGIEISSTQGANEYEELTRINGALYIGRGAGSTGQYYIFGGKLDDFRLYGKALSSSEIKTIMKQNITGIETSENKDTIKVSSLKNGITIHNAQGKKVRIYGTNGIFISEKKIENENTYLPLNNNSGYLLEIDGKTFKTATF